MPHFKLRLGLIVAIVPLTTVVSHSFGRSTYPLLLPVIRDDILGSNTQAGIGGTVVFIAYLLGVVLVTALASRFEPITILRSGVGVGVLGLGVLATAKSLATLLLGLALASAWRANRWPLSSC